MKKKSVIMLAIIVGIISSLTTMIVMSQVFRLELFRIDPQDDSLPVSEFMHVEEIIEEYYLHEYSMEDLQYAGLKAMVAALGDPYSIYYTPEEFASFKQDAAGEYFGLGMVISMDEEKGLAKVEYFFDGSAAEAAGIKAGDYIVSVNGEDVTEKSLQEISVLCMGEEGTSLKLGVLRGGEVFEFKAVRKAVNRDMVTYSMLEDRVGYMRIVQFGGNCEKLFGDALKFFEENGARGAVIDLRDNPGGYLSTVVNVLDVLLPEGTVVYTEDKKGAREVKQSDAACVDMPLVVVVNGNTASAAEIFAGAVQDFGYGDVVGTKTYGKGVVQIVVPITSTGGGLKITTSQYYTPSGRTIDKNGIYPDHFVELQREFREHPENYSLTEDAQIKKAIEVLAREIDQ